MPTGIRPRGKSWEAWVYDRRDGKKIRKTFPTQAAAKSWPSDAVGAQRHRPRALIGFVEDEPVLNAQPMHLRGVGVHRLHADQPRAGEPLGLGEQWPRVLERLQEPVVGQRVVVLRLVRFDRDPSELAADLLQARESHPGNYGRRPC
jgi:hypothetical protein